MPGFADEKASDRDLLDQVGSGDEGALAALYERYARTVFAFVSARVADRGTAEEINADVWLGCWRSARGFRGESQVLTWLLGIARRQIWSHTRGYHPPMVEFDAAEHDLTSDDLDPIGLVVSAEQTEALVEALEGLPPDLIETARLAWVHELPYGEIAAAIGIPVGTVKSRISRARRILSSQLRSSQLRRNDG